MIFTANFDLYKTWEDSERVTHLPYIAVFKKNGKTLIYLAEDHGANLSFDMTYFCFSEKSPAMPQIALVEYENVGRPVRSFEIQDNNMIYAAAIASKIGIPVVYADLSHDEMLGVLQQKHPDEALSIDDVNKALSAGGPSIKRGKYNFLSHELDLYGRDPFMIKNITAALNEYDVVLAVFGEGHYRSQRLILEDMLGKPEYITTVPNSRGDFENITITPIKLVHP
ncbi:MAG: hypothetical protein LBU87_07040 [Lactobacillales bacterium]|jgi:hypothetical protein|nr:hypothetical protein [Lactobacillales bacterium]